MRNAATAERRRTGALLALPAAALLLALLIGPSAAVLLLSLTDYQFGMPGFGFVGFRNYVAMFSDPAVRNSLVNTLIYVGVVAPLSVGLALWLSVLIVAQTRMRVLFQTVFFLPVTATLVAMATAWEVVLHPSFGMVNVALSGLGFDKARFLSDPSLALGTLAFIGVWKTLGYNIVLFLAGMATIDRDLYEAAAVDGADSGYARFVTVTLPMLAPVTLFVSVITLIRTISEFETIAVLTNGGPNGATDMMLFTLYEEAFRFFQIGFAAALAVTFLAVVAVLSLVQVRFFDRRVRHA